MEKVSMLTLDSSDEVEEPTEVSFTAEDITDLTKTPASTTAPSAMTISSRGTKLPSTSPIRPRAFKRTMTSISTTPMTILNDTEESTVFQHLSSTLAPRRKRHRGMLADCPRLPLDHSTRTLNQPNISPFGMYDKRLDGLVHRLTTPHEIPSLTSSPNTEQEKEHDAAPNTARSHHERLSLPPVVSWMKPRMARNGGNRQTRHFTVRGRPAPPPSGLSALESLALELEASPILAMPVLFP